MVFQRVRRCELDINILVNFLRTEMDRTFFLGFHWSRWPRLDHTLRFLNFVVFEIAIVLSLSQEVEFVLRARVARVVPGIRFLKVFGHFVCCQHILVIKRFLMQPLKNPEHVFTFWIKFLYELNLLLLEDISIWISQKIPISLLVSFLHFEEVRMVNFPFD